MAYVELIVLTILALALFLVAAYYGLNAWVKHALKPLDQVIARNLVVTDNWLELATEKPATPPYHTQKLFLSIRGYKFNWEKKELGIKLPDGTIINPEIQIEDKSGNLYDTKGGTRSGNLIGFSGKTDSEKQRVIVRIRSDKPFECSSIGWRTKRMK
jgi:hypothetical protein